jgi:hypothetical protein
MLMSYINPPGFHVHVCRPFLLAYDRAADRGPANENANIFMLIYRDKLKTWKANVTIFLTSNF